MSYARCVLCGEPMPPGEEMFKYHGYSGPCPKPPLPKEGAGYDLPTPEHYFERRIEELEKQLSERDAASDTPRTDEEMCDGWSGDAFAVSVEFARGLEKQLAEAKTEIEAMRLVVEAAEAYYKGREEE